MPGHDESTDLLLKRLTASTIKSDVADLVLAACIGGDELVEALGGAAFSAPPTSVSEVVDPPTLFLGDVTVQGFRGIAGEARLGLKPGPGITLVVGRNGSGKSSFADATELALTGLSSRWANKAKLWEEGWACLHHQGPRSIELRLVAEGQKGDVTLRRSWAADASLEDAKATVQRSGETQQPLASLGLDSALATWRPFLSYSELGGLVDEGPSKLYDAISAVLGLESWVEIGQRLTDARKTLEATVKAARVEADRLRGLLEELDDERATAVLAAMPKRGAWDLAVIEDMATGIAPPLDEVAVLMALANLSRPDPEEINDAVGEIQSALTSLSQFAGTNAARSSELAELLEQALAYHSGHDGTDCPVCGTGLMLDLEWAKRTQEEVSRLKDEAAVIHSVQGVLRAATARAKGMISAVPVVLSHPVSAIDVALALAIWTSWAGAPDSPKELAAHLEEYGPILISAIADVREAARKELERRRDVWQPIAAQLTNWLPKATHAQGQAGRVGDLKAGAAWVDEVTNEVRNQRFAPIADKVLSLWEILRQSSNVELTQVRLEGSKTRRHVELDVSVDDVGGAGISVMSQGELHAIALSLFLPRATRPESPFRFIVIDDPVQSMDASRVDGLAQVLEVVAKEHQVIVFTHDERLPDACRRLRISARILEVSRGTHSEVTVRAKTNPTDDYLADALAVLKTDAYPLEARRRVVPGLCRNAVEAACIDAARRRLLKDGVPFDAIEARLDDAGKLLPRLALAMFGDAARAGDVLGALNGKQGSWAADCAKALSKGAHGIVDTDPMSLVQDSRKLANEIAKLG
jgi:recombinational DNA repair ATPase RecF